MPGPLIVWGKQNFFTIDAWAKATGQETERLLTRVQNKTSGSTQNNLLAALNPPSLVNTESDLNHLDGFKLRHASPLIKRGINLFGADKAKHDIYGNAINSSAIDIGAHSFSHK